MVVFVSFPILLAALTAFAVSINSRNIMARHPDFFGMYELAGAATVSAILAFEEAYLASRHTAHKNALFHFGLSDDYLGGGYFYLADYVNRFEHYIRLAIWQRLQGNFTLRGNDLTRTFNISLGTDHVFNGTIRITTRDSRVYVRTQVIKASDNIMPMRSTVRGVIYWPTPADTRVYFCDISIIKNLDFFTPRVVELKKYGGSF